MCHGICCDCPECRKIRKLLRDKAKSKEIYITGDKDAVDRIMKEE